MNSARAGTMQGTENSGQCEGEAQRFGFKDVMHAIEELRITHQKFVVLIEDMNSVENDSVEIAETSTAVSYYTGPTAFVDFYGKALAELREVNKLLNDRLDHIRVMVL